MPTPKLVVKKFEAVLERVSNRLNWTIARVPPEVSKAWGVRGQLRVKGEINGFAFRTALFPTREHGHMMMVNKQVQKGSGIRAGMKARFRLEPDTEKREMPSSPDLERVLKQSKTLKKFHDSMSFSMRRDIARWINQGKQAETRKRRAEQLAERLMLAMEGERELPPVLQVALARNLKARAGWELMPPGQRRWNLLGIFGYRNPESQARRIAKAVEAMVECAEKHERKRL